MSNLNWSRYFTLSVNISPMQLLQFHKFIRKTTKYILDGVALFLTSFTTIAAEPFHRLEAHHTHFLFLIYLHERTKFPLYLMNISFQSVIVLAFACVAHHFSFVNAIVASYFLTGRYDYVSRLN